MNFLDNLYKQIMKGSYWKRILFTLVIILVVIFSVKSLTPKQEGFVQLTKFEKFNSPHKIYDNFYADIYDEIYHSDLLCEHSFEKIKEISKPSKTSRVLDIGSGTGCMMREFNKVGIPIKGIDNSQAMINKAKEKNTLFEIKKEDVLNTMAYPYEEFTHILCLYFTIYYLGDKHIFFQNAFNWLEPGGTLVIHLVNRDKFDPIVPAGNPLIFVSPQRYAEQRITNSVIKFKDFQYKSNFRVDTLDDKAYFNEEFRDDSSGKVRKHEHVLYMPSQKAILGIAKDVGFVLKKKYDMVELQYEYQYLYFLQKPHDY